MTGHPNAKASLVTTVVAAAILHVAKSYTSVDVSDEQALAAAGGLIAAVLFVGRRGVWPTIRAVWLGGRNATLGTKDEG